MLKTLINFYSDYPNNFLSVKGKHRSEVGPALFERLEDHRELQLSLMRDAKFFQIDEDTESMLSELFEEMNRDGLVDTYDKVKLPFPTILLESAAPHSGLKTVGLLVQDEGAIYTQRFLVNDGGVVPSMWALEACGFKGTMLPTPTQEVMHIFSDQQGFEKALEQEQLMIRYLLGLAVGMSTLLTHRGMFEVEEAPLYSRSERRRAEKAGHLLPATRVSKIRLGEAGLGQLDAMRGGTVQGKDKQARRRAHWVRGHFMRNPAGGLSWRMPHIRGAGPLINQVRHITSQ